jgi:uncharacterized protein YkwD
VRPFALLATIVTCAIAAPSAFASSATGVAPAPALERSILDEINDVRAGNGLGPVRPARGLEDAAGVHGRAMVQGGFFAHESVGGVPSWVRISRFYPQSPVWQVGENLLWRGGNLRAGQVVRAWLESPAHRVIMLSAAWRHIGVAVIRADRAPGVYGGRRTTVVVADFGVG